MTLYPLELEANLIQLTMIIIMTLWYSLRNRGKFMRTSSLFYWGLLAHVLMNVYWFSMILVDGMGNYATFTACDTATIASFLIWSTLYHLLNKSDIHSEYARRPLLLWNIVLGIWNVVWWTLWSGNIVINLLWGVTYTLFSYMIFYSLEKEGVITKLVKNIWLIAAAALFVFQIFIFLFEQDNILHHIGDFICDAAWLAYIVMFAIMAIKDAQHRTTWLFASMLYSLFAQYLTDGVVYSIFVLIESVILFALISTFKLPEIEEADV